MYRSNYAQPVMNQVGVKYYIPRCTADRTKLNMEYRGAPWREVFYFRCHRGGKKGLPKLHAKKKKDILSMLTTAVHRGESKFECFTTATRDIVAK